MKCRVLFICLFLTMSCVSVLAQSKSGTYQWKYKNTAIGVLNIKESGTGKNKRITFEIHVEQSEYPCIGEMSGKLTIISSSFYEYTPSGLSKTSTGELNFCRLSFAFNKNEVVVRETSCEDFHGARCNFEGSFTKVKH